MAMSRSLGLDVVDRRSPASSMVPLVGSSRPASIRRTVDLPQPDGPEEHQELAVVDLEVEGVDGDDVAEALRDRLEADPCHPPARYAACDPGGRHGRAPPRPRARALARLDPGRRAPQGPPAPSPSRVLAVFMVVELVAGFVTGSLALLSDAGHMLTDVIGLGMALAAIHLASRGGAHPQRTFGLYRLEILAALANAVLLVGVAVYVLVEAVRRFQDPPDVATNAVLVVAALGLGANLVAFALLREGAQESLNVEGAYLEVLADTVGSVGVIVGTVVMRATGWYWIDPVIGVAIGLWILPRTWRLGAQAVRILVQAAPAGPRPGRDPDEPRRPRAASSTSTTCTSGR